MGKKQPAGNVAELPVLNEVAPPQGYEIEIGTPEDRDPSLMDRFVYSGFFPARVAGAVALIACANFSEVLSSVKERISR